MNKGLEALLLAPIWIVVWAVQLLIKIPVAILGLFLQPIMYKYRNTHIDEIPWYLIWLTNPEDQYGGLPGYVDSIPPFWRKRMEEEGWSLRYAHWFYSAVRNPADGLRNFRWLQAPLEPEKIKFITNQELRHYEPWALQPGDTAWYVCWNGIYCGLQVVHVWNEKKYLTFKWGFRIHPSDIDVDNIDWSGTRARLGASMATKFLPYRDY
jgi:hypothetical protein